MPTVWRELRAFLTAALIPAALPAMPSPFIILFSFPIALLHVALLAMPAYYVLRRRFALTAGRVLLASFLIGAIPIFLIVALASPAPQDVDAWGGGVPTIAVGVRSWKAWLEVATMASIFGLLGTCGGLFFWLIMRDESDDPTTADEIDQPK